MPEPETDLVLDTAEDQVLDDSTTEDMPDDGDVVESDDDSTTTDDQKPDDDSTQPDDEPADDADADDELVEFDEWSKQFDGELPEDIKSDSDLMEGYLALQKQLAGSKTDSPEESAWKAKINAALEAKGISGGVEALLSGDVSLGDSPAKSEGESAKSESYFPKDPFTSHIKGMVESGLITKEEEGQWKALARVQDQVMSPVLNQIQEVFQAEIGELLRMREQLHDLQWKSLDTVHKGKVDRKSVDNLMLKFNFPSYEQALNYHLMTENPGALADMQKAAKEKGFKDGHKKLKRSTSIQRGKQKVSHSEYNWVDLTTPDGILDEDKLSRLDIHKQAKIADAYEKHLRKKR